MQIREEIINNNYGTVGRSDIIPLYLLRFVCAMLILLHHVGGYFGIELYRSKYTLDIAVDFFFILSGFMMYYIYPNIKDKGSFILQRISRLYPVHLLLIILYILILGINCPLGAVIANIFCIQSFFLTSDYYFSLNSVSWCVCVELFFYACYAIGYKHIFKSLMFFIGINAILYLIVYKYNVPYSTDLTKVSAQGLLKFFPPARALQFFAGCCAAFFLKYKPQIKSGFLSNLMCLLGIFLVMFSGYIIHLPLKMLQYNFIIQYYKTILICVGIYLCCYECNFLPSKLSALLGKISFSLFMIHQVVERVFIRYKLFDTNSNVSRFAIYLLACILLSLILYYFVEQPVYGYLKKHIQQIKNNIFLLYCKICNYFNISIKFERKNTMKKQIKNETNKTSKILLGLLVGVFVAVVATATSYNYWHDVNIRVTFNADSKKDINYQVFYTEESGQAFNEEYSVKQKVKAGTRFVKISLPINKIRRLRLDFGVKPGTVTINNLKVSGDVITELSTFKDYHYNQIDSHMVNQNGYLTIVSDKDDPYIGFTEILNNLPSDDYNWFRMWLIAGGSFIVAFLLAMLLNRKK